MSEVRLISITPDAEKLIAYCARVSNPANQSNENIEKLLQYCINHGHWSIFEMANMVVEIKTSRAISAQILRHRSFSFQEFSQRYAEAMSFETQEARSQDLKNRQNSIDDVSEEDQKWFKSAQNTVISKAYALYHEAISKGIAKECARALLPMSTSTTIYMNGTIRSYIHYLKLRCHKDTQLEHREIADKILVILKNSMPIIGGLICI